jgi:hypothetical protein
VRFGFWIWCDPFLKCCTPQAVRNSENHATFGVKSLQYSVLWLHWNCCKTLLLPSWNCDVVCTSLFYCTLYKTLNCVDLLSLAVIPSCGSLLLVALVSLWAWRPTATTSCACWA